MQIKDSNRVTYGTRLSDRIWSDSNGQLICRDAVIARTGSYDYLESEVIPNGDPKKIVKVYRTEDEVFDPVAIASFENKPFVDDHPQEDVSPDNFRDLSVGYMRDVRRGTADLENCLICDIVVTDPDVIEEIKSGRKRELSLGYDTNIVERDGKYYMTAIRGNHLALVDSGRAGCATIRDSAVEISKTGGIGMRKSRVTLFDDDIFEVEELESNDNDEVTGEGIDVVEAKDDEPTLAEIYALLQEIKSKLDAQVTDDDEEVKEIEEEKKEEIEDDDEKIEEDIDEDEEIEDGDEEIEEEKEELLDADELFEEETEAKDCRKTRDAKSVYKKFARVTDSRKNVLKKEITNAWQDRYNSAAKKSF